MKALLSSCVLVALTGCGGMVGHWQMDSIDPESARAEFAMSRLCLEKDGSFTAHLDSGTVTTGTWDYDADNKTLTLKSDGGAERSYKACLCGPGGSLLVESAQKDQAWKATMKRLGGSNNQDCGGTCSVTREDGKE